MILTRLTLLSVVVIVIQCHCNCDRNFITLYFYIIYQLLADA